jgi:hypothetical protein
VSSDLVVNFIKSHATGEKLILSAATDLNKLSYGMSCYVMLTSTSIYRSV